MRGSQNFDEIFVYLMAQISAAEAAVIVHVLYFAKALTNKTNAFSMRMEHSVPLHLLFVEPAESSLVTDRLILPLLLLTVFNFRLTGSTFAL